MAIKGITKLPVKVSSSEALILYKKLAHVKSLIGKLNSELNHSIASKEMLQILSLNESVQSTRIEGTQVTFADMIDNATTNKNNKSKEIAEVENYRKALEAGVEMIQSDNPITSKMLKQLHAILMSGDVRGTVSGAGQFRKVENFIGPSRRKEDAVYIPVAANMIDDYMTNLEYYINSTPHISFEDIKNNLENGYELLDESSDPLIKTAIIHGQFESIHPFLDGNGRLGRILIVLSFMADKLIDSPVFFISEELERERVRYYNRLNGIRGNDPDWFSWIEFFLDASERMAETLLNKLANIDSHTQKGLELINNRKSTLSTVWLFSISRPFTTATETASSLNIAPQTARKHLNRLTELGLIERDNSKKRNRVYINYDLLQLLR